MITKMSVFYEIATIPKQKMDIGLVEDCDQFSPYVHQHRLLHKFRRLPYDHPLKNDHAQHVSKYQLTLQQNSFFFASQCSKIKINQLIDYVSSPKVCVVKTYVYTLDYFFYQFKYYCKISCQGELEHIENIYN